MFLSLWFPRMLQKTFGFSVHRVGKDQRTSHKSHIIVILSKALNVDSEHYLYFFAQFFDIGAIDDRIDRRIWTGEQDQ